MKICILQSSHETSESPLAPVDPYRDVEHYFRNHEAKHSFTRVLIGTFAGDLMHPISIDAKKHQLLKTIFPEKATVAKQIRELSQEGYDVFINLCEGAFDEDRAGIEVMQFLEKYNLPFTGSDSKFYEPSKEVINIKHWSFSLNLYGPFI